MLTNNQKTLIKDTVPVLRENGVLLTDYFYKRMFRDNPELRNVFNMANQQNSKQQTALAMAILAYAEHIDNPSVLMPAIAGIGHKHVSLDIRPEHYQIVGKHLLGSIQEVLGASATPELLDAWAVAYQQLADIMSGVEGDLYEEKVKQTGGWSGWKPFIIKRKEKESSEITSFYLYPADGGPVADFIPGQYLSIRLFLSDLGLMQPRQYSISNAPNGMYYRISVKREGAGVAKDEGLISNRLHDFVREGDMLEVSAPAGSFNLQAPGHQPVVFISGGVGQTPLMSMLEDRVSSAEKTDTTWIHGCKDVEAHAFKKHLEKWSEGNKQIKQHIFYDTVTGSAPNSNTYEGWVDLSRLGADVLAPDAAYYLCGPAPFISMHFHALIARGVRSEAIHFEEFGPQTLQLRSN